MLKVKTIEEGYPNELLVSDIANITGVNGSQTGGRGPISGGPCPMPGGNAPIAVVEFIKTFRIMRVL